MPRRNAVLDLCLTDIVNRYRQKPSIRAIAIHYGVQDAAIRTRLVEAGVKLRTTKGKLRQVPDLPPGKHFYDGQWWIHYPSTAQNRGGGGRHRGTVRTCCICDELFVTTVQLVKEGKGRTCSAECRGQLCAQQHLGKRRYRSKHFSRPGDVKHNTHGYLMERVADSEPWIAMSFGKTQRGTPSGWVLQHRLVMAKHLGRPLDRKETVHHINGIKDDNRISNLQLRTGPHGVGVVACCRSCGSLDISFEELAIAEAA